MDTKAIARYVEADNQLQQIPMAKLPGLPDRSNNGFLLRHKLQSSHHDFGLFLMLFSDVVATVSDEVSIPTCLKGAYTENRSYLGTFF